MQIPNDGVPYAAVVPTAYGPMLVNRHDINQTNTLFKTGRSVDHNDITMLAQILQLLGGNRTFVDIGANFGCYALALARMVGPQGQVHAIEAQRIIYYLMAGTVAMNGLTNVFCHHLAMGDHEGQVEIPQFDYNRPLNFGSIEFGGTQQERLDQQRANNPAAAEFVRLTTLDALALKQADVIKIDVEGMEMAVLAGARETIARCRPVLFIEVLKTPREALSSAIAAMKYDVYQSGINVLCIPHEKRDIIQVNVQK